MIRFWDFKLSGAPPRLSGVVRRHPRDCPVDPPLPLQAKSIHSLVPRFDMTLRRLIRPSALSLATVLLIAIPAVADPPVLDVVVTSTLATPKEHVKSYREVLHEMAVTALMSLSPADEPDNGAAPTDGAAKYRLFVDHKGVVVVGNALKVFSTPPIRLARNGAKFDGIPDNNKYELFATEWYLPYEHKGAVDLRLAEWKGGKYQTLLSWSAAIPESHGDIDPVGMLEVPTGYRLDDGLDRHTHIERKGLMEVARLKEVTINAAVNFKSKCPKKVEEARTEILNATLPADYSDGLFQRLVSGRVVKAKTGASDGGGGLGSGGLVSDREGRATAELLFLNKSPWPVKKVKVTVVTATNVLIGMEDTELEFAQPLAPGKSALLKHSGAARANDTRLTGLKPGVTIKGVEFDPK